MPSNIEKAERVDLRRTLVAPFLGLAVLSANQWLFFGRDWDQISAVHLGLWIVMILFVFALVATGGLWFSSTAVRTLADDEITRESRKRAFRGGFAAAMLTALVVFVVSPFEPLSAQRAAHIVISVSLGVVLVAYGIEEIRRRD